MMCPKCKRLHGSIDEHHIHPRFADNKQGNGRKIALCHSCHTTLHMFMLPIMWGHILECEKPSVIKKFEALAKYFMNQTKEYEIDATLDMYDTGIKICKECGCENDVEDKICDHCCETLNDFDSEYEPT